MTQAFDPLAPDEVLVSRFAQLVRQDMRAGRLEQAADMLALLQLAAPVHATTFELSIALASEQGQTAKANAYAEVASWV